MDFTAIIGSLAVVGKILFFFLPIIALVILYYMYKAHPIKVRIYQKRGNGYFLAEDRVGRTNINGVQKYKFLSFKRKGQTFEPPNFEDIWNGEKGQYLTLEEKNKGEFRPAHFIAGNTDSDNVHIKPIDRATRYWESLEIRDKLRNYGNVNQMLQYIPVISLVVVGIFIVLALVIVKGDLSETAQIVANSVVQLSKQAPATGGPPI